MICRKNCDQSVPMLDVLGTADRIAGNRVRVNWSTESIDLYLILMASDGFSLKCT